MQLTQQTQPKKEKIAFVSSAQGLTSASFIIVNGIVHSRGRNDAFQQGISKNNEKSSNPVNEWRMINLPKEEKFISLASSMGVTVFLTENGTLYYCGSSSWITSKVVHVPMIMNFEKKFISVSAGLNHFVCIDNNSKIYGFGENGFGQLGISDNEEKYYNSPRKIPFELSVSKVSCGSNFTLLLSKGKVYSMGTNSLGQLGTKSDKQSNSIPEKIDLPEKILFSDIGNGRDHCMAITVEGKIYSWGCNNDGQLGLGHLNSKNHPVQIEIIESKQYVATSIAGGWAHSLAIINDGDVYAWGLNSSGQVSSDDSRKSFPKKVEFKEENIKFIQLSSGNCHNMAMSKDMIIYAWGYNGYSQVASDTISRFSKNAIEYRIDGAFFSVPLPKKKYETLEEFQKEYISTENDFIFDSIFKGEKKYFSVISWIEKLCPDLLLLTNKDKNLFFNWYLFLFSGDYTKIKEKENKQDQLIEWMKMIILSKEWKQEFMLYNLYSQFDELCFAKEDAHFLLKEIYIDTKVYGNINSLLKLKRNDYFEELSIMIVKKSLSIGVSWEPEIKLLDDLPRIIERQFMGKNKPGEIIFPSQENKIFSLWKEYSNDKSTHDFQFKITNENSNNDNNNQNNEKEILISAHSWVVRRWNLCDEELKKGNLFLNLQNISSSCVKECIHFIYFDRFSDWFTMSESSIISEKLPSFITSLPGANHFHEEILNDESENNLIPMLLFYISKNDNVKKMYYISKISRNYTKIFQTKQYSNLSIELQLLITQNVLFEMILENQNNFKKCLCNHSKTDMEMDQISKKK